MQADARQLFFLKSLLKAFAESTGLHVNYRKSQMLPVNVSTEKMELLAQTFGCSIGTLVGDMPKSPSSQYGLKAQKDIDPRGIRVTNGPMR